MLYSKLLQSVNIAIVMMNLEIFGSIKADFEHTFTSRRPIFVVRIYKNESLCYYREKSQSFFSY